jgi:hypothetical protein
MSGVRRLTSELLRAPSPLSEPRLIDTITACTKREARERHRLFLAARHLRGLFGLLRLTYGGTRLRPAGT